MHEQMHILTELELFAAQTNESLNKCNNTIYLLLHFSNTICDINNKDTFYTR